MHVRARADRRRPRAAFGGEKNFIQSLKLVAYSLHRGVDRRHLPAAAVHRRRSSACSRAIYSFYTFYLGAPVLKKCAPDKAVGFTIVVVVCGIVLGFVLDRRCCLLVLGGHGGTVRHRDDPMMRTVLLVRRRSRRTGAGGLAHAAWPVGLDRVVARRDAYRSSTTDSDCVTQKEIDDGSKSLPKPGDDCTLSNVATAGRKDDLRLRLPRRRRRAQGRAEFVIEATRYEGKLDARRAAGTAPEVATTMTWTARRDRGVQAQLRSVGSLVADRGVGVRRRHRPGAESRTGARAASAAATCR